MNSKILVTGANGQLGNEIRRLCRNFPGLEFIFTDVDMLDITNPDAVSVFMEASKPAIVVNCAAYTNVDGAEDDVKAARKVNALAPQVLAAACAMQEAFLIHISTDYVFDGEKGSPYNEEDETNPISVYGSSKLEGEEKIKTVFDNYLIIRTSWLYSEYGHNFMRTILALAKEKDKIEVISDQYGSPTYARDLANCIIDIIVKSILNPRAYLPGIYHYTNQGSCSWNEFAQEIINVAGITTCEVVPITTDQYPHKAQRPRNSILDTTKVRSAFGIGIPNWKDSLRECLSSITR
ncbi:MAG TPA: dTDP-4-dehydrorhamnose reductase [Prolixibacteraceae bacterium]|nr:dTDP-4-dehydrorhamnose reductase [Bacteroidales bacterium]HPB05771.1 dTDP-4-dehydrorhamnose reductase [Prolixibacteraceae bacterium]HQN94407.1 dTDP-4-dehydrorhamnose reductase [Prolixibacteraceae bacterium]HUM88818.1 dTDP-4-dehydrorhamnose reductase [Prolixibacteraceae bacterium]